MYDVIEKRLEVVTVTIVSLHQLTMETIEDFFVKRWGSVDMVTSSGIYNCNILDGFAFLNEHQKVIGLITYVFRKKECEIVSLDSAEEGKGIGTILVQQVENNAMENGKTFITLITTNDNLNALKFYQKRGYHLSKIYPNAVEKARQYKPQIPLIGEWGIPIRDEIELQKKLN